MLDIDNLTPNIIEVYKENAKKQIWKGQVKYINQVFHIFRCKRIFRNYPSEDGLDGQSYFQISTFLCTFKERLWTTWRQIFSQSFDQGYSTWPKKYLPTYRKDLIGPNFFWPEAYLAYGSSKLCEFILL